MLELAFVVPCTAVNACAESALRHAGGCTRVIGEHLSGEWAAPDGQVCIEPVRTVLVACSPWHVGRVVRGIARDLGLAGEQAVYVRLSWTPLATIVPTSSATGAASRALSTLARLVLHSG